MNRPRVASQIVSRDSTRCFYCKEPGHIARLCLRRQEDENRLKRGSTNMMANIDSLMMHMSPMKICMMNRWNI